MPSIMLVQPPNNVLLYRLEVQRFWYVATDVIFVPPYGFRIVFIILLEEYNNRYCHHSINYAPHIRQIFFQNHSEIENPVGPTLTLGQLIGIGRIEEIIDANASDDENESRGGSM
jgi:hypothetical protein